MMIISYLSCLMTSYHNPFKSSAWCLVWTVVSSFTLCRFPFGRMHLQSLITLQVLELSDRCLLHYMACVGVCNRLFVAYNFCCGWLLYIVSHCSSSTVVWLMQCLYWNIWPASTDADAESWQFVCRPITSRLLNSEIEIRTFTMLC